MSIAILRTTKWPRLAAFTVAVLMLGIGPAAVGHAASSDWAETEGGRMRLTALPPDADGVIRAVLDVDLMPGWKTYWRDPGESGIPPQVDFGNSSNVDHFDLAFPPPRRIDDGYSVFAGYKEPVAFPITIGQQQPGQASRLQADVFIGVCSTICIPFQATFALDIDSATKTSDYEKYFVEAAFRRLPEPASGEFSAGNPTMEDDGKGFSFDMTVPKSAKGAELFVSGPAGWYFSAPEPVADGGPDRFRVSVISAPRGADLSGGNFKLLVVTDRRSMETVLKMP